MSNSIFVIMPSLIIKVRRRLLSIYFRYFKHSGRETRQFVRIQDGDPRVLVIAPGEMVIPNDGWGAVEIVVAHQIDELRRLGFGLILLNSWFWRDWIKTIFHRPHVILLHYDAFARRTFFLAKILRVPTVVVSHFGYAAFENKWNVAYSKNLKWLARHDRVVALSPQIKEVLSKHILPEKIRFIPNAAELNSNEMPSSRFGFIYLGKIEERKLQANIVESLDADLTMDFAGPIAISGFSELIESHRNVHYLGTWSRTEVLRSLPKYKSLVLYSDGEADALVLHEAQQAGLHVIVSSRALGSQDPSLPWVHVCDDLQTLNNTIRVLSTETSTSPEMIIEFARKNLTWESRGREIGNLLLELIDTSR